MYILVDNHHILRGIFTSKNWLNDAIHTFHKHYPETCLYYQKIKINEFSDVLINFCTMHPENLIEIDANVDKIQL